MSSYLGQARAPANTRLYAIGDVHGHLALLKQLWSLIEHDLHTNPIGAYRIIFLGDYIDRGPDSAGCVDFLIAQSKRDQNLICLKGNHEDKLQAFLNDPIAIAHSFFTYGGVDCANSYGLTLSGPPANKAAVLETASALAAAISPQHQAFYAELRHSVAFGDYFFAHAGIRPGVPLNQQNPHDLMWIRQEFIAHTTHYEKVIVHGHTPAYPMELLPNRINVDTHAYDTGVLSCIVLEEDQYRTICTVSNYR